MDAATPVVGVIEIQRVPHGGIDPGGLRCRDLGSDQQHATFRRSAPAPQQAEEGVDTRSVAPPEHGAQSVQKVAAAGHNSVFR